MVSLETPVCDFGAPAIDFELPGTDGKLWTLEQCRGEKGLLVMFICNHCPYVKAIRDRLVRDTRELMQHGINSVAIMANDPAEYPEDSFENMQKVAEQANFPFPYLLDESQSVARAYGAVCTPDFFGYNADLELQYRGWMPAVKKRLRRMPAATSLRRCCRWLAAARGLMSRFPVWVVPLNGRSRRSDAFFYTYIRCT
jgi:peroxiredoxin